MGIYNVLQLDPIIIKNKIKNTFLKKEKITLFFLMALRSLLIVLFATAFISLLKLGFGAENMPMAVSLFCMLLGIRFVDFNYRFTDSIVNLGIILLILTFSPVCASIISSPFITLIIHFISFFTIVIMSCNKPELGNGGLYNFAYIYLCGNPVYGAALVSRLELAFLGFIICGIILYIKHRHNNPTIYFKDIILTFNLRSKLSQWQFRFALGMAIILTLGEALNIPRYMWAAFACVSLLSDYPCSENIKEKSLHRIIGVLIGSGIYLILTMIIPNSMVPLLGPLGGFCMGFCTKYTNKTAVNCLGALMMASSIYGINQSILLRITDTFIGVIISIIIAFLFKKCMDKFFPLSNNTTIENA